MKKMFLLGPALLCVAFLVGAGCDQPQTGQTSSNTSTPVVTNQAVTETPVPVVDDTASSSAYQNEDYGFTFTPPKEWQTQSRASMASLGEKAYVGFTSGFSISVWDTSTYTFDDLKAEPPGGIDPDSVKTTEITIDGQAATEISYVSVSDTASGSGTMKRISILKDDLIYIIEGSAEDCAIVVPTFKFTD